MLSEGPRAFPMLPECTFITQLIRQYHDIINYSDKPRFDAFAKSNTELASAFNPAIRGMIDIALSHFPGVNAQELILKDPELTLYIDCLPAFFDKFKLVCVIRDPRDVVASFARVSEKKGVTMDFESLIGLVFNYYYRASISDLAKANHIHFLSFEKISNGNEDEFRALESFLGYRVGRSGFGKMLFEIDKSDATFSDNYGKPKKSLTKTMPALSQEEISTIENAFAGYNATYGWW